MRTLVVLLVLGSWTVGAGATEWTQADLLNRMLDLDRLADPPSPGERPLLFSSFDRRQSEIRDGKFVHWDGENDSNQFLGQEDGWDLLVDASGPGALQHIWVDEPAGRFRLEIDGRVVYEDAFVALFDGSLSPFGKPLSYFVSGKRGANLYFPIAFQRRARLLTQGFRGRYQVDATWFGPDARVAAFRPDLDEAARTALERVVRAFSAGLTDGDVLAGRQTMTVARQEDLAPGSSLVEAFDEGGTIRALYVSLTDRTAPRELYALHHCVVRITWDDGKVPDIELPLASFFGSGFDRNPYNSLAMGTDRWLDLPGLFPAESYFMYCLLPMPFSKARIEIENRNARKIGLMLYLRVEPQTPGSERLRLRTTFRVEDPCKSFDYALLQAEGPGRIVGTVLNIDTPRTDWWGRGDHKVWVDGESFPSLLGTGTADYFGNVADLQKSSFPLHGASLVNPYGKNSLYRWHLGDALAFHRQVQFTLENWQKDQVDDVYYNSIVYWYGPVGTRETTERLRGRDLALPGLRIPGAVEIEGSVRGSDWGSVLKQKYAGGVELSGEQAVSLTSTAAVAIGLPSEKAGRFRLRVRTHPRRSFGTIRVARPDGTEVGTVTYDRREDGIYPVGTLTLERGVTTLQVTCDRPTVLDCWVLEEVAAPSVEDE